MISCLCCTKNRAEFMPWLLWNYDKQTAKDKELVVIDSSATPVVLPERADIRVLRLAEDTPLGEARNVAMDAAQGEFFAWFDDDDWYSPYQLERLVDQLSGTHELFIGQPWFIRLDLFSRKWGFMQCGIKSISTASSGFRTKPTRKVRFKSDMRVNEDSEWLERVLKGRMVPPGSWLAAMGFSHLALCHDKNVFNLSGKHALSRPISSLQASIGEHLWGDTSKQLDALQAGVETRRRNDEADANNYWMPGEIPGHNLKHYERGFTNENRSC